MRTMRWGLSVFGVAVAAAVVAFGVLGFGVGNAAPGPGRGPDGIFARYDEVLAQKLGIGLPQLQAAQKAARDQLIDDAVKAGKLTQEQAARLKSGQGNRGQGLRGGAGPAMAIAKSVGDAMRAAAATLKMTPEELRAALRNGQSLGELAQSKGVSRDALKAGIMASVQNDVNAAVREGKITAQQGAQITERVSQGLDRLIDQKMGQRRPGGNLPGAPNPGNPGQR